MNVRLLFPKFKRNSLHSLRWRPPPPQQLSLSGALHDANVGGLASQPVTVWEDVNSQATKGN